MNFGFLKLSFFLMVGSVVLLQIVSEPIPQARNSPPIADTSQDSHPPSPVITPGLDHTTEISDQERAFAEALRRSVPEINQRQRIGRSLFGKSDKTVLKRTAMDATKSLAIRITGSAGNSSTICERALWGAAYNATRNSFTAGAYAELFGGIGDVLVGKSFMLYSGNGRELAKIATQIAYSAANDKFFGVLDLDKISDDVQDSIAKSVLGYILPDLTTKYADSILTREPLVERVEEIAGALYKISKDKLLPNTVTVVQAEGFNNSRSVSDTPKLKAMVTSYYNEMNHYVTLLVRGGDLKSCPALKLYILKFEVDRDGLILDRSELKTETISL